MLVRGRRWLGWLRNVKRVGGILGRVLASATYVLACFSRVGALNGKSSVNCYSELHEDFRIHLEFLE